MPLGFYLPLPTFQPTDPHGRCPLSAIDVGEPTSVYKKRNLGATLGFLFRQYRYKSVRRNFFELFIASHAMRESHRS